MLWEDMGEEEGWWGSRTVEQWARVVKGRARRASGACMPWRIMSSQSGPGPYHEDITGDGKGTGLDTRASRKAFTFGTLASHTCCGESKTDIYIGPIHAVRGEGIVASNAKYQSHPAATPIACRGSSPESSPFSSAFLSTLQGIYIHAFPVGRLSLSSPSRFELGQAVMGGHSGQGNITWLSEMIASRVAVARDMAVGRKMTQTLQTGSSEL